jgi:hypothetical protein
MEEGAHLTFKVPPPGIEFTLPSPKIGIESLPVVDPPWMPQVKTKVEEVTISQESHVSKLFGHFVVTVTDFIFLKMSDFIKFSMMHKLDNFSQI